MSDPNEYLINEHHSIMKDLLPLKKQPRCAYCDQKFEGMLSFWEGEAYWACETCFESIKRDPMRRILRRHNQQPAAE